MNDRLLVPLFPRGHVSIGEDPRALDLLADDRRQRVTTADENFLLTGETRNKTDVEIAYGTLSLYADDILDPEKNSRVTTSYDDENQTYTATLDTRGMARPATLTAVSRVHTDERGTRNVREYTYTEGDPRRERASTSRWASEFVRPTSFERVRVRDVQLIQQSLEERFGGIMAQEQQRRINEVRDQRFLGVGRAIGWLMRRRRDDNLDPTRRAITR